MDCGFAAAQCGRASPFRQLVQVEMTARLSLAAAICVHAERSGEAPDRTAWRQSRKHLNRD